MKGFSIGVVHDRYGPDFCGIVLWKFHVGFLYMVEDSVKSLSLGVWWQ